MKIRTGFVSNSSSSSFLIYGIYVDKTLYENIKNAYNIKYFDELDELESFSNLSTFRVPDCETRYIGRSWNTIKDDETGLQFKENVKDSVKKLFSKTISSTLEFNTYEEAWYDG